MSAPIFTLAPAKTVVTQTLSFPSKAAEKKAYRILMQQIFAGHSFRMQLADHRHFHQLTLRERVHYFHFPAPQFTNAKPTRWAGPCCDLVHRIRTTVDSTVDALDYNGLHPYLKLLAQLNAGKSFETAHIDTQGENEGSTCVGMSHALMRNLKAKHGVDSAFASQRKNLPNAPFEHAAVVIECDDGYVLVDARSDPSVRLFAVPYGMTLRDRFFSITAAKKGDAPPLTLIEHGPRGKTYSFYTNIFNGADSVAKHFIMWSSTSFTPIVTYTDKGPPLKSIIVCPELARVILKNHVTNKKTQWTFQQIRAGEMRLALQTFMGPIYYCQPSPFHTPFDTVYRQIAAFVSQEELLKKLFRLS